MNVWPNNIPIIVCSSTIMINYADTASITGPVLCVLSSIYHYSIQIYTYFKLAFVFTYSVLILIVVILFVNFISF